MSDLQKEIDEMRAALSRMEAELKQREQTEEKLLTLEEAEKLPIDTPILVRSKGGQWHRRYFSGVANDLKYAFNDGSTSREERAKRSFWAEMKRDFTAKSIINWIPNTGVKPEGKAFLGRLRSGALSTSITRWEINHNGQDVIEYAIIE
jgi:hypothetical protein